MLGLRGKSGRPELIEKYGFDTKFAMHMVRLGWLRDLRQGEKTREEALEAAESLEHRLDELVRAYLRAWKMP